MTLTFSLYCLLFNSRSQIWNIKPGWGSRPDVHIEKGHSDDITGLKFSSDGRIFLSRSFDGSLKVNDHTFIQGTPLMLASFIRIAFTFI